MGTIDEKAQQDLEKFAKNIKLARVKKELVQQDVSEISGLTQQMVSNLEKAGYKPRLDSVIKYLLTLGIDINKIFEEEK